MEILVIRQERNKHTTLGQLFINGALMCDSIEPVDRGAVLGMSMDDMYEKFKVGSSAIPQGEYLCEMTWNADKRHYLPKIKNVPFKVESYISWGFTWRDNPNGITIGKWNSRYQLMTYSKNHIETLLGKIHAEELFTKQPLKLKIVWQEF